MIVLSRQRRDKKYGAREEANTPAGPPSKHAFQA
jgi:hypothetical protein